jgi:uncharacterized protein
MNVSAGLIQKKARAISVLRAHRAVVVALSGGVDSATLLAIACEALGPENVLAVTGRSGAVPEREIEDARRVAGTLGVRHTVVDTHEIESPGYKANNGDRCYHCRTELFDVLEGISLRSGIEAVAYGAIVDDLGDDRPGMEAARKMGVLAPLLDAEISKSDVRELAYQYRLHIHDKPSNACLASRIPMGSEVTPDRLAQVDRAETALRRFGFRQFRVRHHGEVARIELSGEDLVRLASNDVREEVVRRVKEAGFRFVALDLEGYNRGRAETPAGRLYSITPVREGGQ